MLQKSLSQYIQTAWPVVDHGASYKHNWHIDCISEYLEAVKLGQIKRLVINIPPRMSKSLTVAVCFPTWVWTTNPEKRFIKVSYSYKLSEKHNVMCRDLIRSDWYKSYWGEDVNIRYDMNMKDNFKNYANGYMFSTSVGGTVTGEGGDYIIVDDPQKPDEAFSEAVRNSVIMFFKNTLITRLNDQSTGAIILIMQRLHELDAAGYFLGLGYTHLNLQARADEDQKIWYPVSNTFYERKKDEVLDPVRLNEDIQENLKRDMGPVFYSAQYQQKPVPTEGIVFKQNMFQHYYQEVPKSAIYYTCWDLTFKKGEQTAECACVVMAKSQETTYIVDCIHQKAAFKDQLQLIQAMRAKWKIARTHYIENAANAQAVTNMLENDVAGMILLKPMGDKAIRAHSTTGYWEAGNILMPDPRLGEVWVADFLLQHLGFPKMVLKDIVDATSLGIIKLYDIASRNQGAAPKAITGRSYWRH